MFAHANPPHGSDDVHLTRRSTDLQTSYELCMYVCVLKGIGGNAKCTARCSQLSPQEGLGCISIRLSLLYKLSVSLPLTHTHTLGCLGVDYLTFALNLSP